MLLISTPFKVEVSSLTPSATVKKARDDSKRPGERDCCIPPTSPCWSCSGKTMRGLLVIIRRKQSAFTKKFGLYDSVISAYLNSLTRAIKTKIQSAASCLVRAAFQRLTKNLGELDTARIRLCHTKQISKT